MFISYLMIVFLFIFIEITFSCNMMILIIISVVIEHFPHQCSMHLTSMILPKKHAEKILGVQAVPHPHLHIMRTLHKEQMEVLRKSQLKVIGF